MATGPRSQSQPAAPGVCALGPTCQRRPAGGRVHGSPPVLAQPPAARRRPPSHAGPPPGASARPSRLSALLSSRRPPRVTGGGRAARRPPPARGSCGSVPHLAGEGGGGRAMAVVGGGGGRGRGRQWRRVAAPGARAAVGGTFFAFFFSCRALGRGVPNRFGGAPLSPGRRRRPPSREAAPEGGEGVLSVGRSVLSYPSQPGAGDGTHSGVHCLHLSPEPLYVLPGFQAHCGSLTTTCLRG